MILTSTFISAVAQYYLKFGVTRLNEAIHKDFFSLIQNTIFNWPILLGFSLYVVGAVLWLYVLSKFELSKAYPFASLGYVFSSLIGYYVLHDNFTINRLVGIGLIIIGVIFISQS